MPSASEIKFNRIASRFFTNDEDRRKKLERDKAIIDEFINAMMAHIKILYNNGVRLYVFKMNANDNCPTIHLGLFPCCGLELDIPDMVRQDTEDKIKLFTRFKRIIWEDLQ